MGLKAHTLEGSGVVTLTGKELGSGGEGAVFEVLFHDLPDLPPADELVAKLYHNPREADRVKKLKAMVRYRPHSTSVAWPLAIVVDDTLGFKGYLMEKLPSDAYKAWGELAHAKTRRGSASGFDVRYGLTAIRNFVVALTSVHAVGHRVGDINESNIFIGSDAKVLLVDTDSAQISTTEGLVFPCLVGKPEYTAPELSRGSLRNQTRTIESDVFGLAIASYQMLTGGAHPTDGIYKGVGEPPSTVERMRAEIYPGLQPASPTYVHPARIASGGIPTRLRKLLLQSLSVDPAARPGTEAWLATLDELIPKLTQCERVPQHWFDSRDGYCGWCIHGDTGQPDPWAQQNATQTLPRQMALPAVGFHSATTPAIPQRAPQSLTPGPMPPQNAHPSTAVSQPPTPPIPPAQPPGPRIHKGRVVLTYGDGSSGPRPNYSVLLRDNPRLAFYCMKVEMPSVARFWWPASRNLAHPLGLGLGLLLATLLAIIWLVVIPPTYPNPNLRIIWEANGYIAAMGAMVASLLLVFSGLWDRRRARKSAGSLDKFIPEKPWKTVAGFGLLAVIYGPLLVLGLMGAIVLLGVNIFIGLTREVMRNRA